MVGWLVRLGSTEADAASRMALTLLPSAAQIREMLAGKLGTAMDPFKKLIKVRGSPAAQCRNSTLLLLTV